MNTVSNRAKQKKKNVSATFVEMKKTKRKASLDEDFMACCSTSLVVVFISPHQQSKLSFLPFICCGINALGCTQVNHRTSRAVGFSALALPHVLYCR